MSPTSKTGRLSLAVVARLVFVRTEAIGCVMRLAVLSSRSPTNAARASVIHRGKHPLRALRVRCGCSAIGAALSATPMRNRVMLEWAVGRGPEGDDVQRSAGMFPRGGGACGTGEIAQISAARNRRSTIKIVRLEVITLPAIT